MKILGLLPARGGSKSLPRKSIVQLLGRPLMAYTAEAALQARSLDRVVLSTDDPEIAAVGCALRVEVPFLRPAELARDDTLAIDVIRHALQWFAAHEDYRPDAVMLLQPTSPLRRSCHIDAAADLLHTCCADSVVSVVQVPHQFNPASVLRLVDGSLEPYLPGAMITRRQDKPVVFARNGPAVLLTRRTLLERGELYGRACRPLLMDANESADIDEPRDLEYVAHLLARRAESDCDRAEGYSANAQHV